MSNLFRIYLVRGLVAIAWAVAFSTAHESLSATSVVLLVAYPLIDVVATLLDTRQTSGSPARTLQVFNTGLSAAAAVGLGVAAISGIGAVLATFGVWAVVSGAAQFTVALRRRAELGRQWPSLTAGALSVIAGATYLVQAADAHPSLQALITYTAAGGTFFVLQAAGLAWRQRRMRSRALSARS
ncbi:membrane protein [Asanoa ishikariensis]|uniref:Uncharacterized membrane protein HdeD, DUF308 family n=1 Tax=Asanoa ishikariensis TaxID=137265 RepID=A0A1H3T0U0_9ACTN|nr:hypothetical protein [Asanoa ishikariensis]GIF63260.1 membrane protein [Asanoa ishikariensis]SDZ42959.1 Uncharacterized membrane protein HdeD, DUF308 family [Asanoa ishikariensis]